MTVRLLLLILLLFLLAGPSCAGEVPGKKLDMHDLTGVLKQAAEKEKSIFLPESQDAEPRLDAAEALMKQFQTPEYQARIRAEQQRLQETVFKEVLADFAPQDKRNDSVGKLAADERVYLFFSSSVPLSTLRSYAMMIDRAGDPNVVMVLRGFVGGMKRIRPTMEFIGNVLKKNRPARRTSKNARATTSASRSILSFFNAIRSERFRRSSMAPASTVRNKPRNSLSPSRATPALIGYWNGSIGKRKKNP